MKIGLTRSLVCLVWFDRCLISCLLSTELRQGTGDLSFHVGKDLHISWDGDSPFHPRCGKKLSLIRNGIPSTMPLFRPEGRSLEEVEIVWVFRFYLTVSSYSAQKMIRCLMTDCRGPFGPLLDTNYSEATLILVVINYHSGMLCSSQVRKEDERTWVDTDSDGQKGCRWSMRNPFFHHSDAFKINGLLMVLHFNPFVHPKSDLSTEWVSRDDYERWVGFKFRWM